MNMLTNSDVERVAVAELTKLIARTSFASPHFNVDDKNPCWDGNVLIHDNIQKANGDLINKIDVQIKGKQDNDLSRKEITFTGKRSDFNSYLNNGGCIYFVVLIDKKMNTKAYFASLLPLLIKRILNESKGEKTINFKLKELPIEPDELDALFQNHFNDRQMQYPMINGDAIRIEDVPKLPNVKEIFSNLVIPKNTNPFEYLVKHDFTQYVLFEGQKFPIAIDNHDSNKAIKTDCDVVISNDGEVYFNKIKRVYTENEFTIYIGDCLTLKMNYDNRNKIHFHIEHPKFLKQVIDNQSFIISVLRNKGFECNGNKIDLPIQTNSLTEADYEKLENNLIIANKFKELMKLLKISKNVNLEELKDNDWNIFWFLYNGLILNKKFVIDKNNFRNLIKVKLGSLNIIVACLPIDEKSYELKNVFNTNIPVRCYDDEKNKNVSQFAVFKAKDFYNIDNINYSFIYKSIIRNTYDDQTVMISNNILLELLSAYDECPTDDLFHMVKKLVNWLKRNNPDNLYIELNYYQIIKRVSKLTRNQLKRIKEILNSSREPDIRFCCYVLLDNLKKAEYYYNKLEGKYKEQITKYPIYNLFKRIKEK